MSSIISVIIFAVNIVDEQKQTYLVTIFLFFLVCITVNSFTAPPALPLLQRPCICMLCQQTSPQHWFANVNMTSYCEVTNSVYPITMTTYATANTRIWKGASNQAVAPVNNRPLHATD